MKTEFRRCAFCLTIALAVLMVMFPPFVMAGRLVAYDFVLSGPQMAQDMVPYSIDVVRLLTQLVLLWASYFAAAQTVTKAA